MTEKSSQTVRRTSRQRRYDNRKSRVDRLKESRATRKNRPKRPSKSRHKKDPKIPKSKGDLKSKGEKKKAEGVGPGNSELLPSEVLSAHDRQTMKEALEDDDLTSIFNISRIDEALNITNKPGDKWVRAPSIFDAWDDVYAERIGRKQYFKQKGYIEVREHTRRTKSGGVRVVKYHLRKVKR